MRLALGIIDANSAIQVSSDSVETRLNNSKAYRETLDNLFSLDRYD